MGVCSDAESLVRGLLPYMDMSVLTWCVQVGGLGKAVKAATEPLTSGVARTSNAASSLSEVRRSRSLNFVNASVVGEWRGSGRGVAEEWQRSGGGVTEE